MLIDVGVDVGLMVLLCVVGYLAVRFHSKNVVLRHQREDERVLVLALLEQLFLERALARNPNGAGDAVDFVRQNRRSVVVSQAFRGHIVMSPTAKELALDRNPPLSPEPWHSSRKLKHLFPAKPPKAH